MRLGDAFNPAEIERPGAAALAGENAPVVAGLEPENPAGRTRRTSPTLTGLRGRPKRLAIPDDLPPDAVPPDPILIPDTQANRAAPYRDAA